MGAGGQYLDPQQQSHVRNLFQSYINDRIPFPVCLANLNPYIGATQALQKLDNILRTPEAPIPLGVQIARVTAKTRPWSAYEDQRLLSGIHRFGLQDWQAVSIFVGNGRSKSQCSQRWLRGLDPKISKFQWSEDQDARLLELIAIHGEKNWTRVSTELGNRCDIQCRYRFKQLQKQDGFAEKMKIAIESARSESGKCESQQPGKRSKLLQCKPVSPLRSVPLSSQIPHYQNVFSFPVSPPIRNPFPPVIPPPILSGPVVGFQTRVVPPVLHIATRPVTFAPLKADEPTLKVPRQQNLTPGEGDPTGISPQNSGMDWKGSFGSSDSTSLLFGISPMNSFKFDT
jgi:hypothetical protein